MARLRVFVVDDEAPARRKILRFLAGDPEVSVVGEAASGSEAVSGIQQTSPDLVFLDVQMPGMDGFEVVRALSPGTAPRIVFVTAHDQYAIQAFDVHAFGYLLKPFDEARFARVLEHAKSQLMQKAGNEVSEGLKRLLAEIQRQRQGPARLLVQQQGRAFFVAADQVDWVEAQKNYLTLHHKAQEYTIRGTMEALEAKLDAAQFARINRSCLVRIDFIRELQNWSHGEYRVVLQSGVTQIWTRRYLNRHPELLQKL
ncbi:MAG: LytTR family DNA-binding domain-containing protein [Acidobacteriia bacterium]|nr:LytTR family DNA-binding domain-containing protein [Terriglobia bacterium]